MSPAPATPAKKRPAKAAASAARPKASGTDPAAAKTGKAGTRRGRSRGGKGGSKRSTPASIRKRVGKLASGFWGFSPRLLLLVGLLVLVFFAGVWVALELRHQETGAPPSGRPSDAAGKRESRSAESEKTREQQANATIKRALGDMAEMLYEESLSAPLEERIKHVDYALIQALVRLNMKPTDASVARIVFRPEGQDAKSAYHFQQLNIAVGADPLPFITRLHESLRAWAEGAELANIRDQVWGISIDGVTTHELHLLVKPLPQNAQPGPAPSDSPGRLWRVRGPGEAARLVIVMDDLGQSTTAVQRLLELPYPVTFAIWPNSSHARETAEQAHGAGREIIVHQPMQPEGYPAVKPGPKALLLGQSAETIQDTVRDSLRRVPHATGLNNHMGSRFTQNRAGLTAVLAAMHGQNLLVLDSMTHPRSQFYDEARREGFFALKRDVFLDVDPSKEAVLRQLRKAEQAALLTGRAIAIGHPLPGTLEALKTWAASRDMRVQLVRLRDLGGQ